MNDVDRSELGPSGNAPAGAQQPLDEAVAAQAAGGEQVPVFVIATDPVQAYQNLVDATSNLIERVANALK